MDYMTVFGAIFIVFWNTGSASKLFSGQRICRRGTERPCYRLAHILDPRQRVSYEVARETCRSDGGELLSIETEDEQRLVERFVHELAGDFWIGLRRSLRHRESGTSCSALYYWLDRSQATYRNWQWDEPSCGREMCVVLHQRPSQVGGVSYKWNDISCNLRHNFICKYSDEKKYDVIITPANPKYTDKGLQSDPDKGLQSDPDKGLQGDPDKGLQGDPDKGFQSDPDKGFQSDPDKGLQSDCNQGVQYCTATVNYGGGCNGSHLEEAPVVSVTPDQRSATGDGRDIRAGVSESSVSSTDATLNILLITIPILLVILLMASGLFCYRLITNRRKEQSEPIYAKPGQWVSVGGSDSAGILFSQQGASVSPHDPPAYTSPSFGITAPQSRPCALPGGQSEDYENVPNQEPASGFVNNDIYESCRNPSAVEAGWVDNEIYGY